MFGNSNSSFSKVTKYLKYLTTSKYFFNIEFSFKVRYNKYLQHKK